MSLKGMFALSKKSIDYKSHRLLTISCGTFPLSFQLVSQCDVSLNTIIYFSLEGCLLVCSRKMILEKKASYTSQCNIYDYLQPIIMNDKRKRIQSPCSSHIKKHWFQFESQPTSIVQAIISQIIPITNNHNRNYVIVIQTNDLELTKIECAIFNCMM